MEETDLHGAEVGVATDKVTRVLSAVSELKLSALKVIYGQGKNSEMGRAKPGPAVREFLAGQHIAFTEAQDEGGRHRRRLVKRRARTRARASRIFAKHVRHLVSKSRSLMSTTFSV